MLTCHPSERPAGSDDPDEGVSETQAFSQKTGIANSSGRSWSLQGRIRARSGASGPSFACGTQQSGLGHAASDSAKDDIQLLGHFRPHVCPPS